MKERLSLCFGLSAFLAFVLGLSAFVGLAGCSANASKTPQTPFISLALTQAPPASLNVVGTAQVSASVSGDPASAGVDWFAECASAPNCGSFSPAHTASGAATTFIAPAAVPAKNTVAVTAVSTTDHSKSSAAMVTILSTVSGVAITQPPPSLPSGSQITLILAGSNQTGAITVVAAVTGDPSNSGVDWKVTCGTVNCTPPGLFSNLSGSASLTVPGPGSSPPVDVGTTIILTAFARADHNFSASTSFTVSAPTSLNITQPPPSSLLTNATSTLIATVANDPSNAGVDWSVSCSTGGGGSPCGFFSPGNHSTVHSASGAPVTFTAPSTPPPAGTFNPAGGITITATATATANGTQPALATANVTIIAPVTVAITQTVPTNSIVINLGAPLVATVSNDPGNAGVDWSATCSASAGNCGSFSPVHTASGAATTYTAPSAAPPGGTVTITAASTASASQTATYTLTVTAGVPPDSLLSGQFVMLLSSKNSSSGPFALGGYLTGDGTGNITTGTLDAVNPNGGLVSVLASTYSIGPDGRGQINLITSSSLGVNGSGTFTLSVVFVTPQHALLTETDSSGTATGTLDRQNASGFAGFSGAYSLQLSGMAATGPNYLVASALAIPSANSYSYVTDESNNGVITSVPFTTVSHGLPVSGGPALGSFTFSSLNLGVGTPFSSFDVWVIDATHFVVTDWRDIPNVFGYLTAQPSSPALSGAYAFTEAGATGAGKPQAAGGIVTCGSSGTLDVVSLGGIPLTNQPVNAMCTVPANGRGLISISAASGASTGGISQFAAYPTIDQGLYLIELDGGAAGTSGPSSAGVALSQTLPAPISASALHGAYVSEFAASTARGSQVFAGQILADGVSALNGNADVNSFNATATPPVATPSSGAALSGSFTGVSDGRFPTMLAISPASGQPPPEITPLNSACYIVNANTCLLLGLDATAPATGILQLQNTGL